MCAACTTNTVRTCHEARWPAIEVFRLDRSVIQGDPVNIKASRHQFSGRQDDRNESKTERARVPELERKARLTERDLPESVLDCVRCREFLIAARSLNSCLDPIRQHLATSRSSACFHAM